MSEIDFFSSMSMECPRSRTRKQRVFSVKSPVRASRPQNSVSPGNKVPATDAEHLYSRLQAPRRVDWDEDAGSMRSADRDVKTGETPTDTDMTFKIKYTQEYCLQRTLLFSQLYWDKSIVPKRYRRQTVISYNRFFK